MLTIVAEVCTHPGQQHRDAVLALFREVMPAVLNEPGCYGYTPMLDSRAGLDFQSTNPDSVMMIEKWQDLAALQAHREAPHMVEFHRRANAHISGIRVRILEDAA